MDFTSVSNVHERAIFDAIHARATDYPGLADDGELLADVACVALNRVPPRYIRHATDWAFYLSEEQRRRVAEQVDDAVTYAFGYVQARHAMAARR